MGQEPVQGRKMRTHKERMENSAIQVVLSGESACFPRPEFYRDEISYDVLTPSAARGVLDRVHWRPAIRWMIDSISVLRPVRFSEQALDLDCGARARSISLRDVAYRIDAHFVMTSRAGALDEPERHRGMFRQQIRKGASVYLGSVQHPGKIRLLEDAVGLPECAPINETRDLGWMVHEADYQDRGRLRFFRAQMVCGVIKIPLPGDARLFS